MSGTKIRTESGPSGEILHLVPYLPSALPPVTKRDIEQAWEAARAAALMPAHHPATHAFRFAAGAETPLDLVIADRDAAFWAAAIDRIANLGTPHGISICLRLLALFQAMATDPALRKWFDPDPGGAKIHSALLQAAALAPLTPTGAFAETTLQALLPPAPPAARKWSGTWPGQP